MLAKLRTITRQLKVELAVYRLALHHPQTPSLAKVFLGLALGYLLLPFDLIPDFIPIIGQIDELIIIPILLYFALLFIPKAVIETCRLQAMQANSQVKFNE